VLNETQLNEIETVLSKAKENTSLFNVLAPNIWQETKFTKKLENAMLSYCPNIDTSKVLVLFDETVFGSAEDGFVITHDAIYYKETWEDSNSIKLANNIEVINDDEDTLYIGGVIIKMLLLDETVTTIAEIMEKIVEFNSTPTENELITKTLTSVAQWISTLDHEEKVDVHTQFIQVVNDFKSHNDLNKIISPLIYATESIKDCDFPDAQKQMDKVYQLIKVNDINNFDGLLQCADSLIYYMKDRNRSRPYYQAAENKIASVHDAINLAGSLNDTYKDKEWAKKIYNKAQELSNTYQDFYDVGTYSGGGDGAFNDFACQNLLTAYEKISQSNDHKDKQKLVLIADLLVYWGKDVANAQKIVRDYLDNYANSLDDYSAVFYICASDEYLNDLSLSQEVFSKAKALCRTYSDYHKLLEATELECEFCSKNFFLSFAKEVVTKFENNIQKEEFIDYFDVSLDKSFLTEVKNSSIEELKQKYGSSGANDFDEELELTLPSFDEIINSNEPESKEELTLDDAPKVTPESDLKAQYAAKIISGKIDPIEVSFADFEAASKNKEIDYKAIYSQMISEGRIDPTATTFEEMIKVSKLFGGVEDSEYKISYSKYIVSGEIDPSETTYDEIVSIAAIFNKINNGS